MLSEKTIEYWNNLQSINKDEDGNYIVPYLPVCDTEQYNTIIVAALLRCGAIPKSELIVGETYLGDCRNASEATWNGEKFVYKRYKFGSTFDETINHFMDDDGHDVFVPMELKDK